MCASLTAAAEYIKSAGDEELLRDEDRSTQLEGGWKSINTLRHCRVVDGAHFRLVPRRDYAPPGRSEWGGGGGGGGGGRGGVCV